MTNLFTALFINNGPIALVVALGGLGVYLLLPRPRPYAVIWGVVLSLAAIFLAGWLLVRVHVFTLEALIFYFFSFLAVGSGILTVTQPNPARSALAFALVVLATCGLFLLQAAPFLMAATTIIYAGAIIVTFLFVLMLAQQEGPSDADQRCREPRLATIAGFLFLGAILYVIKLTYATDEIDGLIQRTQQAAEKTTAEEMTAAIGEDRDFFEAWDNILAKLERSPDLAIKSQVVNVKFEEWSRAKAKKNVAKMRLALNKIVDLGVQARSVAGCYQPHGTSPLSFNSGPPSNVPLYASLNEEAPEEAGESQENAVVGLRRSTVTQTPELPAENVAYLGRSLFTDYLVPVELGGTLLLVATAGAIVIAGRRQGRAQ